MTENFKNFIGGQWGAPATGAYFENRNPADRDDVIGCFPRSGPEDVARAVASAQRGFAQWSKTPAPVRGEVLHRVGNRLSGGRVPSGGARRGRWERGLPGPGATGREGMEPATTPQPRARARSAGPVPP